MLQKEPYEIIERTKESGLVDSLLAHMSFGHVRLRTSFQTHEWHNDAGYLQLRKPLHPIVKHQIIFR